VTRQLREAVIPRCDPWLTCEMRRRNMGRCAAPVTVLLEGGFFDVRDLSDYPSNG